MKEAKPSCLLQLWKRMYVCQRRFVLGKCDWFLSPFHRYMYEFALVTTCIGRYLSIVSVHSIPIRISRTNRVVYRLDVPTTLNSFAYIYVYTCVYRATIIHLIYSHLTITSTRLSDQCNGATMIICVYMRYNQTHIYTHIYCCSPTVKCIYIKLQIARIRFLSPTCFVSTKK